MPVELVGQGLQHETPPPRPVMRSLWRGLLGRCPNCGAGPLFRAYLKVADHCPTCGEALHHHRADDAPPYFTIFIVGHVVVAAALYLEQTMAPPLWLYAATFIPLTIVLSLLALPPIKGALVAYQWALRMHGFDPDSPEAGHE